jgi:phospholipid/cholesterol/gamma-HCH transport system substrate-binding protein
VHVVSWFRDAKPLRERNPMVVAVVGLVLLGVAVYLAFDANNLPLIGGGTSYTAYFAESAGLSPGNEVRVAGVTVGRVTGVSLAGNVVKVTFVVKNTWVGDASTAAIDIKTILGAKYLALDPVGGATQDPAMPIPLSRTTSPYDVTQAFNQLGQVFGQLNTAELAKSLETISQAFANTPPAVHESLTGLASLSRAIASQDTQLYALLQGTRKITATIASQDSEFQTLISDGNLLLAELRLQQQSIASLLTGTEQMAAQISTLVQSNDAELGPLLDKLGRVTSVLQRNQSNLNRAFALLGPYSGLVANTLGNGRWFDSYLCGLVTPGYGGTQPNSGCMPPKVGG